MGALLMAHLVTGLAVIVWGERLGRDGLRIAVLAPAATVIWLLTKLPSVIDGAVLTESVQWVPQLGLALDLRLDGFAALMVMLVSGIGVAVFTYANWYFPARQVGLGRLIGLLTLFSGAMLGLVLADNLLVLYGCWELTSVASFFLIGNRHSSARARAAALQALLITGAGALAMLVGFILLGQEAGTYRLSSLLADPPTGGVTVAALVLVLAGAVTKSAQYPFHSWLPGAMVAPTPVSAYLHSATMVKAGVYLVARFTPAFVSVGFWRPAVVTFGVVTMIAGGLRALRQHDLKLLLAFGTVSQLGFMFVLFGLGTPESTMAGCVLLLAHGVFKATLFMSVGVIDHELGTRDVREVPRLSGSWPVLSGVVALSAASMAGIPLLFGFIAKEAGYEALLHSGTRFGTLLTIGVVGASMLTFAYSARLVHGALFAEGRTVRTGTDAVTRRPAAAFVAMPVVLTSVTVLLGVAPFLADGTITAATSALELTDEVAHLAIWHGLNTALLLSAVTIAGGVVLFMGRTSVSAVIARGAGLPSGSQGYRSTLRLLNLVADRVTGVVQNGSLPVYAGVILATTLVVPAFPLARLPMSDLLDSPVTSPGTFVATALVCAVLLAAALSAAMIRRRFAAALLLAGVGYSMAALFVIQGAPDLALTTVAVESLFTVLFVLVLRSLPDRFEQRSTGAGRGFRLVVAATVGMVVFVFALIASGERLPSTTSEEIIARSLPDGHGRNIVNVILVDFRGFDTLGEITVLAAAAIGAVALARAVTRPGRPPSAQPDDGPDPTSGGAQ